MNPSFFRLHKGLPREAPGDVESLEWALDLAKTPKHARILDAGCGPGADLTALAELRPAAKLIGMDLHGPFIEQLRREQPLVKAIEGDMLSPEGQFDFIWSAGAAYSVGVEAALKAWAGHLAPNGAVAFSDCLWRVSHPSPKVKAFWQEGYPGMCDLAGHIARIEASGWRIRGARWLGEAAWQAYYGPLSERIQSLRYDANAEMTEVLDAASAEIDLWRDHGGEYGYYLTVVTPA